MSENRRIGKYEIQALLGKGGSAGVFAGLDGDKPVALKIANRATVPPETLTRLREGAPTLARVRHPAIATFIELVETDKVLCIVSELAVGEPLTVLLKDGKRPDLRQTWEIARQVLEALEATHARGALHGELKPSSVILDKEGRVKVTDLGAYSLVAHGTTPYMAPEQFNGEAMNARTDLYQAAAMIYHLVTGKPPFAGARDEMVHRIAQERPTDPSSFVDKLAWQLDWVIQRALSKDPTDRFGSAREFMDGLRLGMQDSIGSPLPVPAPAPAIVEKKPAPAAEKKPELLAANKPEPVIEKKTELALEKKATAPAPPPAAQPKPDEAKAPEAKPPVATPPAVKLSDKARLLIPVPIDEPEEIDEERMRVLFVDDEERVLNALKALFRNDYEVFTAENGAKGLEVAKRENIAIVVSDQRMPGMTGVEMLRELRKTTPQTVRLLLTGYSDLAALVGSINDGEVFRFIRKPWDNEEIRAMLGEAAAAAAKLVKRAPATPATAAAEAAPSPRTASSILVIDPGQSLAKGLERLLAGEARVQLVATVPEAAKLLQSQDYAAILADLRAGKEDLVKLFRVVKAKRPGTLSILVAEEPDADLVAELINQAQIYRFLQKPIDGKELRSHVSAALRHYAEFMQSEKKGSGRAENVGALPDRLVTRTA